MRFRVTELWCDLCGHREVWDNLGEATANGWRHDRWANGTVVDLCTRCARKVLTPEDRKDILEEAAHG